MLIHVPSDRAEVSINKLKADLIYYTKSDGNVAHGTQYPLLEDKCSQVENSCTEDVHGNRLVFVEEQSGKVDELFLIVRNEHSLNDATQTESFSAVFSRQDVTLETQVYFWVSALWVIVCMLLICVTSQLAAESDASIALQKKRYLESS